MKKITFLVFLLSCSLSSAKEFNIYVDADFSIHKDSANAIFNGIDVGLESSQKLIPDHTFNLIKLDHRGNTRRSLSNFKKVLKDPNALVVYGGLHSPPLITNNNFINENKVLTMVTWAAGGPITRSKVKENWIYRLSVDDSQAGEFIANYAVKEDKCSRPVLLLEDTPWGKSNKKNMSKGLSNFNILPYDIIEFGWGVSSSSASEISQKIKNSIGDCIFFVGNGTDAKKIFNAFGTNEIKLPVFSHWGITSGSNKHMAKVIKTSKLKVKIIQTKFSFLNKNLNAYQKSVKNKIFKKFNYKKVEQIAPMSGWVHSIDLTSILFEALKTINLKQDISSIRNELKIKMENLNNPVEGLLKTYKKPFSKYSKNKKNSHEALRASDYIMYVFDDNGNLRE